SRPTSSSSCPFSTSSNFKHPSSTITAPSTTIDSHVSVLFAIISSLYEAMVNSVSDVEARKMIPFRFLKQNYNDQQLSVKQCLDSVATNLIYSVSKLLSWRQNYDHRVVGYENLLWIEHEEAAQSAATIGIMSNNSVVDGVYYSEPKVIPAMLNSVSSAAGDHPGGGTAKPGPHQQISAAQQHQQHTNEEAERLRFVQKLWKHLEFLLALNGSFHLEEEMTLLLQKTA
ncbi:unnamed protein product, partial [Amoebophrya sp. A120]